MKLTVNMYQEKKEELDLPVLKQRRHIGKTTSLEKNERGLITATRNDTDDTKTNRMTITRKQKNRIKTIIWMF